jgi:hypothetical protein
MNIRPIHTQLAGFIASGVAVLILLNTEVEPEQRACTANKRSFRVDQDKVRVVSKERREVGSWNLNVDKDRFLKQITSTNPVTRLHGIDQIERHDLWPFLIEKVSDDPTLAPCLAEASSRVAPEIAVQLLHAAISHGDLAMTPELEESLSGIGDEVIYDLLCAFPYESSSGTKTTLLEQIVAGAGTKSLGKLVHDAESAEPEVARSATRLISMIRNPETGVELRALAKADVTGVSEAAQEAMAKIASAASVFGADPDNPSDTLFSSIPKADQSYLESEKSN